jgi:hypothetical protein
MDPQDILLCNYPRKLTVGQVRKLLLQKDKTSRRLLADFVLHRLQDRYITPLEKIPREFQSGFLMMAASCLMIETIQCFREGKKDTKQRGMGRAAFESFFKDYQAAFPGIDGKSFYENYRCGILHQAQTQGGFRVLRRGSIYDGADKSIHATRFLKKLKKVVREYASELRTQELDSDTWIKALKKIDYICQACES